MTRWISAAAGVRKRGGILLLLALVLASFVISRVISFRNTSQLIERTHVLNDARNVRGDLADLSSCLRDAQWHALAFQAEGKREDEERTRQAIERARALVGHLRVGVPLSPPLSKEIEGLEPEVNGCCGFLEGTLAAVGPGQVKGDSPSTAMVNWGSRLEELDGRIHEIAKRTDTEVGKIETSEAGIEKARWRIFHTITAIQLAVFCLLALVVLLYIRRHERANRAESEAAEKYRVIADNTHDWEYWLDPEGRFVYCSPACERITGYSPDEFERDPGLLDRIVHPEFHGLFDRHRHDVVSHETAGDLDFKILHKDGGERWINHVCQPVFGADGRFMGNRGSNRDITTRKRAEEELHRAHQKLENRAREMEIILNGSPDAAAVLDRDGVILAISEVGARYLEKKPEQVVGTRFFDHFPPESAKSWGAKMKEVFLTKKPLVFEDRLWSVDFENRISPILDEQGNVINLVGFSRDITDRKRLEEKTRVEQRRLSSLVKISQVATHTVQELLDLALEEAVALSDSRLGYIYHYDEDTEDFTLHAWSREVMKACSIPDPPKVYHLRETGIWGEAVRQRKPIVINDFSAPDPLKKGYPEGHAPLQRYMTIPVSDGGRIVAVAGVANKEAEYTELDVRQLTQMMESVWRIAGRKQAEEALRESEERFRTLTEAAFEGIAITEKGLFVDVSPRLSAIWGYEPRELIGKPVADYILPEDRDLVRQRMAEGYLLPYENRLVRKDGSIIIAETRARYCSYRGREVRVTAIHDITERKRAERAREITYRISEAAQAAASLKDLFSSIHGILSGIMAAKNFYIALLDDSGRSLSFPYFVDEREQNPGSRLLGRGATEYVLRKAEPCRLTHECFGELIDAGELRHMGPPAVDWLGVPLKVAGRTIGVMATQSYQEGVRFSEEDVKVLGFVSSQVAMAIERKRTEESISKLKRQNELILDSAGEGIFGLDGQGRITFANPMAALITGYKVPELLGKDSHSLLHHTQPSGLANPRERCPIHHVLETGEPTIVLEDLFWREDNTPIPVGYVGTPIRANGHISGAVVTFRDITERLKFEEALRRGKMEWEAAFDAVVDLVLLTDVAGRVLRCNRMVTQKFETSYGRLVGRHVSEALFGSKVEAPEGFPSPGRFDPKKAPLEVRLPMLDGWYDVTVYPIRTTERGLEGYVYVLRDVTQGLALEEQLRQSQKMEAVGALAGGVAHDFNNLLQALLFLCRALELQPPTAGELRENLQEMDAHIKRGAALTRQLLLFSRPEVAKPEKQDLNEVVTASMTLLR